MKNVVRFFNAHPYVTFFSLIVLIYGQTLLFGYSLSDLYVIDPVVENFKSGKNLWHLATVTYNLNDYRPIVLLSYGIEYLLFGQIYPGIAHLINIILYFLVCALAYLFLKKTLKQHRFPFLIVILFVLHPIHVEVVASLKNRDVLLSALFVFLSLLSYIKFINDIQLKRIGFLVLSLLLFLLAIFSKLDAVGLVIFVPVLSWYYLPKKQWKIIPIMTFLFLLVYLNRSHLSPYQPVYTQLKEHSSNGAVGVHFTENPMVSLDLNYFEKIPYGIHTGMLYVKKLFVPTDFCYYYGYPAIPFTTVNYYALIFFGLFIFLSIYIIIQSKEKNILWMFITGFVSFILYALNIIAPLAGIIADRLVFVSSIFLIGFFTVALGMMLFKHIKTLFFTASLILLSVSIYRTSAWKNIFTLIERDFPKASKSYEAMRIAANNYKEFADTTQNGILRNQYLEKAIHCSQIGHQLLPEENKLLQYKAVCEFALGNIDDAEKSIKASFRNDTTDAISYKFLGDIYYVKKNPLDAIQSYSQALKISNNNPFVINNITTIYLEINQVEASNRFNDSLLKINPKNYAAWENLGYTQLFIKDTISADAYFRQAFNSGLHNPDAANLMISFAYSHQKEEWVNYYSRYVID